mmetsp:Transcript_81680/g.136711  ORF Transcript_81680/g.136711 Transcript_81680/m.136711 type:complete len:84 (+) Transcript_81680:130-381(+)
MQIRLKSSGKEAVGFVILAMAITFASPLPLTLGPLSPQNPEDNICICTHKSQSLSDLLNLLPNRLFHVIQVANHFTVMCMDVG